MMDCKKIGEQMVEYLYQELDAPERERFAVHVQSCTRCQQELEAYERTRTLMQDLPEQEPPPGITAALLQAAAKPAESEKPGFWQRLRESLRMLVMHPAMTAAVTLVVVLGVSFYVYERGAPPTQPEALEHFRVEVDKATPVIASRRPEEPAAAEDRSAGSLEGSSPAAAQDEASSADTERQSGPALARELRDRRLAEPTAVSRGLGGGGKRQAVSNELPLRSDDSFGKRRSRRLVGKGSSGDALAAKNGPPATKPLAAPSKQTATAAPPEALGQSKSAGASRHSQRADLDELNDPLVGAEQKKVGPPRQAAPSASSSNKLESEKKDSVGLELLQRGAQAQAKGRCLEALSLFNQAIVVEPALQAKAVAAARSCARRLAAEDEGKLRQASQANANLAGLLDAELERTQRARKATEQKAKKATSREAK